MKKIAFCFLIYDIINNEELWNIFFKNVSKKKYNIYIHYKNNVELKYFDSFKLNNCIETEWGKVSLVKAQNLLLEKALEDCDNQHFIFVSHACIPFKSFNYIYKFLDINYSYFNREPQHKCFPRCDETLKVLDRKFIQKSSQWCILNRIHTELILEKQIYLKWYELSFAPDEHCYITYLYYLNLKNELIITENLAAGATTFTNWYYMDYKYLRKNHKRNIINYDDISDEELYYIMNSKSLFGRKFNKNCSNLLDNKKYINFIKSNKKFILKTINI